MSDISMLDSLLDSTLDDLADLPEFKNYPIGAHTVLASFSTKMIGEHPAIELSFKYVDVVELQDKNDVPPVAGDTCSVAYFMDNEMGCGKFKQAAAPFAVALGFTTNREIVEGVKDIECVILTGLRKDKNDKEKFYMDVKEIQVV
jgi:hypothetical protein